MHARAVSIEYSNDLDLGSMLALIVEEERLGASLALIIAGPRTDWVHVSPIAFALWMNRRVSVDLGGRGLQDWRSEALGEAQHVDRPQNAGLGGLDRVELVMHRRRGTRQVIDGVHFDIERKRDVVPEDLEAAIAEQVLYIPARPCEKIVDTENFVA